jgi:YjbE family integral membrane protein
LLHGLETPEVWIAFFKVVMIDLVLAGDNAIIIGLAAAGLPKEQRGKAILVGVLAATLLRIVFAFAAVWLLKIIGLVFVGGLLLLWVCWKMWRELRDGAHEENALDENAPASGPTKTLRQAATQIVLADVSMSLDNVLAVAGAAHEHPTVLAFGLLLSVALMGVAAALVARLLGRFRWLAYAGLALVLYVALNMIWHGAHDMWPQLFG